MLLTARPLSQPSFAFARAWQASGRIVRHLALLLAVVALGATVAGAQAAKVTLKGVVKDLGTGAPVQGATVKIVGLGSQVLTNEKGEYVIGNLTPGSIIAVDANRLGYGPRHEENVKLDKDINVLDFTINQNATSLDAVTSSATTDPTTGIKMPMAITRLDADQLPVPNLTNAAMSIQGKVAGVVITPNSGAPGDSSNVQIRSIMSPFKQNGPLYVVDGVPLIETTNTAGDFLGLDIESIEVIRGAAAASLYGSRASGGVIAITTKRGKDVAVGTATIEVRQDMGKDDASSNLPTKNKAHYYKENDYGQWLRNDGAILNILTQSRTLEFYRFQDNPYPVRYDNVHQTLIGNRSLNDRIAVSQATATTNLNVSFNRVRNPGQYRYNPGQTSQNVRFFVNHQLRDNLSIDASLQHNRQNTQSVSPSTSFSGLFTLEPHVNLFLPNKDPRIPDFPFAQYPDSNDLTASLNPLWVEYRYDNHAIRQRNTISTNLSYRPYNWVTIKGEFGYDKSDNGQNQWTQPGWPTSNSYGTGSLRYDNSNTDGFNGNVFATLLRDFGRLTSSLTVKGAQQRQRSLSFSGSAVPIGLGYQTLTGATSAIAAGSSQSESRINQVSVNLKGDYAGKYILDGLVLREGNSRYGPDQRWHNFSRLAGTWLMSEEAWYPSILSKHLTLAKFRGSFGSAGGQPDFSDQFEQVQVSSATGFTRGTLGNPDLAPEVRTETEIGGDFIWNSKISMQLTYSRSTLRDAISPAVASAVTGYNSIQANVGETKGESYEATIEGTVMQSNIFHQRFQWRTNLVGSHSKSTIVKLGLPCYGINTYHVVCDGAPITSIYGLRLNQTFDDLVAQSPSYAPYRDWWKVNDDGILVPVGPGNHYWEGVSKNLWGTAISFFTGNPAGSTVFKADWGIPQYQRVDTTGGGQQRYWSKLGDSQQLFDFGLNNSFSLGNFQADINMRGAVGGDIWNLYESTMLANLVDPQVDQYMKADSLKKPTYYYNGGAPGQGDSFSGLYVNNTSYGYSQNVEKGVNWMKLGEARVSYQFKNTSYKILNRIGATRVSVQASASNLYAWTTKGYQGLDPEATGSRGGGRFRLDTFRYPTPRRYSGAVTVVF